jgi:hypothetical protein
MTQAQPTEPLVVLCYGSVVVTRISNGFHTISFTFVLVDRSSCNFKTKIRYLALSETIVLNIEKLSNTVKP